MRISQAGSLSYKGEEGVVVGGAGGEETTLWYRHKSCKRYRARGQVLRLPQEEEVIEVEEGWEEAWHIGSLIAPLQVVVSLVDS